MGRKPYLDKETNLHYNYFRDYDSGIGRYVQSDPIGLDGGLNTYAYVLGDPLAYQDILGLKVTIYARLAAGAEVGGITEPASMHSFLYLDPDKKTCECKDIKPMTIGGQPKMKSLPPRLTLEFDYEGDNPSLAAPIAVVPTPAGMTDCQFIKELIAAANRYKPLFWLPPINPKGYMPAGWYNSNSIVSGVISAAGGIPPSISTGGFFLIPGYTNPVPIPVR